MDEESTAAGDLGDVILDPAVEDAGTSVTLVTVEDVEPQWTDLAEAGAIIFGAPAYNGSASAEFKALMEKTSGIWQDEGWKDKVAAGLTNSGTPAGDHATADYLGQRVATMTRRLAARPEPATI